jgi:hypothetical protein
MSIKEIKKLAQVPGNWFCFTVREIYYLFKKRQTINQVNSWDFAGECAVIVKKNLEIKNLGIKLSAIWAASYQIENIKNLLLDQNV